VTEIRYGTEGLLPKVQYTSNETTSGGRGALFGKYSPPFPGGVILLVAENFFNYKFELRIAG
jgi:hypothetical protein